jgi:hypothetical protein
VGHLLRLKGGENRTADDLNVFECQMALRDGPGPRWVVREKGDARERMISDCERLH